jgi:NAD(P)-dependent dehydrogenase (short-subunit alcohol dehydrogenase family)
VSDQQLRARVAVVTGASRGIGRQIANALAEAGATTALVGRDAAALEDARNAIAVRCGRAEVFVADVSEETAVERLRDQVNERLGAPDILINNAGIILRKLMLEFSSEEWNRLIQTNLTGPFLCAKAFAPGMIAKKFGRIVNITSIFSHVGYLGRSAYCASKSGLLGLTKALALELAPHNVTVNGVSPGPIATEMNTGQMLDSVKNAEFLARIPVGRWGRPEEIGALTAFLCSEAAGFITGTDILVDGGWTAQ